MCRSLELLLTGTRRCEMTVGICLAGMVLYLWNRVLTADRRAGMETSMQLSVMGMDGCHVGLMP